MTASAQASSQSEAIAIGNAPALEEPIAPAVAPALPGTPCSEGFTIEQCSAEAAWAAVEVAENAAAWTSYGFFAGLAGMAIAVLAVLFAWKAYEAAKAANEISLESSKRQDRAYVDFNAATFKLEPIGGDSKARMTARIELKNFGRTPADDLKMTLKYGFIDPASGKSLSEELAETQLEKLGAIMPDDEWGRNETITTSPQRFAEVSSGTVGLQLEVIAEYLDVFGTQHTLESIFRNVSGSETMVVVAGTRKNS